MEFLHQFLGVCYTERNVNTIWRNFTGEFVDQTLIIIHTILKKVPDKMSFYSPDDYDTDYDSPPLENRNRRKKRRLPPWLGGIIGLIVLIVGGVWVISRLGEGGSQPVAMVRTVTPVPGLLQTAAANQGGATTPPIAPSQPAAPTRQVVSPSASATPSVAVDTSQEALILALVNQARQTQGLGRLSANTVLTRTAQLHSDDQAEHETMTHTGSDGSEPWERAERLGYCYRSFGENVLMRGDVSADGAYDQWWNSPPHKANMLGADFTEIGIAYTRSAGGAYYYTMVLGKPC